MAAFSQHRYSIAVLLLFGALASPAEEIDEIVVTADFRERSANDLAASVSVFDAEQMQQRALQHFEELIDAVPNLNWSGDGHRARYFQIRGTGELEQYQGAPNPSVGFLIDDIDFSGIGTVATLFDMQQVEVLRGPQGTRYGANALAGLIYMQSTKPTAAWSGRVQLMTGEDDLYAGGLAFGGALDSSEDILLRMSVHQHRSNGFRDNPYLGRRDSNRRDETTIRGRLSFQKYDDWQIDLALLHADLDNGYDAFALDNSLTVHSDKPGKDSQQSSGASLRARYAGWSELTLESITAFADSDIEFSYDADWGNADFWAPVTYDFISESARKRQTISQEIRLLGNAWLAGLYAMQLDDELRTLDQGDYYDPGYDFADSLLRRFASDYRATSLAAFGQYDFELSARTRLTAGARLERRTTAYEDTDGLNEGPSESMLGGELSLSHEHAANVMSFVTLSRGYKAGGFNLGLVPDDRREFDAEVMWNAEIGIKAGMLDDALQLNASLFYAWRDGQQVRTSFQLDPGDPASFVFFTDNAADGRTFGLELDARWWPAAAWELHAAVGLLDASFERFRTPQVDLSGREQAHAPSYNVSIGGTYSHPSGFYTSLDVRAQDAFFFDVSHDEVSEPYERVNLRIGYNAETWSIQLWARNVFDEQYAVRGFFFGNEPPDFPPALYTRSGDPRQLGVTFDKRF